MWLIGLEFPRNAEKLPYNFEKQGLSDLFCTEFARKLALIRVNSVPVL
jgi:hypothetical protein